MEFQLPIQPGSLQHPIRYEDKILLTGSCFTEHIGNHLRDWKFDTLQNPHGILFDPASVASSLVSYVQNRQYGEGDVIFLNELWQSWQHHSIFSNMDRQQCLETINASQSAAHHFLKEAKWLIITLGSSFSYRLKDGTPVANCHRAPAATFDKHLMTIEEINTVLDNCLHQLFYFNPSLQILFTISPVRHVRDGVIENNRSKARLIECVHHLAGKFDRISYFPAYELVVDVLRDYRFYDIDLVHPNYAATEYVLEKFTRHCIDGSSQQVLEEVKKIVTARRHKPFQPATQAHRRFLEDHLKKTKELSDRYPFLNFDEELAWFSSTDAARDRGA
jgi:GSCFA family